MIYLSIVSVNVMHILLVNVNLCILPFQYIGIYQHHVIVSFDFFRVVPVRYLLKILY